jgi:hypothetical protein
MWMERGRVEEGGGEDYRTVVKPLYEESTKLFMFYKPTETPFNPGHKHSLH